ncbi:BON domain-containing protein [Parapusillimonas granuli]|uniref:BON domain-containing protein n=1 Tax=Parapusillimonas granuli TaxID=380911 RepID=A0A853G6B1_9BURK|nr:BON domain-containing protein [Parapusillimonas granuli]MBB5214099.1 hyperosmotically inducible protein [Parapusillimonas granuli]MEB2400948.1 BON domain-containing protein [Alcaligenaceae bacterium]NYT50520.1 BON domain-containing protein [Parapusillimonas granuli]
MNIIQYSKALTLIAATAALTACGGYQKQPDTAQYTDDSSINTNVQAAVAGVPGVEANTMSVNTNGGMVKLTGTVENKLAAQNAIQAARQVAGVKQVDFDLKVREP